MLFLRGDQKLNLPLEAGESEAKIVILKRNKMGVPFLHGANMEWPVISSGQYGKLRRDKTALPRPRKGFCSLPP